MRVHFVQPLLHQRAIELAVGLLLSVSALLMALLPSSLLPHCSFARWSGLPCPSCGTTRSIQSVLDGELTTALTMQPLFFIISGLFVIWLIYTLAAALFRWPAIRLQLENRIEILGMLLLTVLLVFGNWTYLLIVQ